MKNSIQTLVVLSFLFAFQFSGNAQDLLKKLDKEFKDTTQYEISTFMTTKIGLGQSVETRKKGALELSLHNMYWDEPNTLSQNFLSDRNNRRYGLSYAFTDNFTFGFGHVNFDKISDGFFKYRLTRQEVNSKKAPVSVTLLQSISHRKAEKASPDFFAPSNANSRYSFTTQAIIARKFSKELSLQISPTYIYRPTAQVQNNPNHHFALGFSGRHKINNHTSVVSEYMYVVNPIKSVETFNTFLVGINWEVSDLMLQFQMSNSHNFAEDTYIIQTRNNFNFKDPNFHFGVNATYIIHTKKRKLK